MLIHTSHKHEVEVVSEKGLRHVLLPLQLSLLLADTTERRQKRSYPCAESDGPVAAIDVKGRLYETGVTNSSDRELGGSLSGQTKVEDSLRCFGTMKAGGIDAVVEK
jgi:hypothetical protein